MSDEGKLPAATDMNQIIESASRLGIELDEAEAKVVRMYYFQQRTQKEIAEELCTSQMNVSRLMRKAQGKLRRMIVPADIEGMGRL